MDYREDIKELMSACIGCRKCTRVCPSLRHGGCDPMDVMQGGDRWQGCIGCGNCSQVCRFTDPMKVMMYMSAVRGGTKIPAHFEETGYNLPTYSGDQPKPVYTGKDVALMPGCIINARYPYLESAGIKALGVIGLTCERYEGGCCTFPVPYRTLTDGERDDIKKRCTEGYGRIVTLCDGCSDQLRQSGADARHIYELLYENLDKIRSLPGVDGLKVAIQPGCHLVPELPEFRAIAEACGAEVLDVEPGCCGKYVKGINTKLMAERQESMRGADAAVVACPACFMYYDNYEGGIPVLHISELVALAAGDRSGLKYHTRLPDRLKQ